MIDSQMKLLLRVDHREPEPLKAQLDSSSSGELKCERLNLPAGDFEFVNQETGQVLLLIERKEVDDLAASLVDGRFDSQKTKMAATLNNGEKAHPIAYLIEGDYSTHDRRSSIESVVLTTRFRDGFFVLHTADMKETGDCLIRIADLFLRGKMEQLSQDELHRRFIASRSAHRGGAQFSKNDEWWVISIGQVPGIGPKAARTIAAQYPTVRSLIEAYRKCKTIAERKTLLQDLIPQESSRRLGTKASERVWRCIMGEGDDRRPYPDQPKTKNSWKKSPTSQHTPQTLTSCIFVDEDE